MNIFCNSEGVIIGTTPEKIFQGSAGVNKIYFVGQFPSSAQVLMSYTLPNGISTSPKMLSHVDTLEQVRSIDGGIFSVWETRIGAVPRINDGEIVTDDNGNVVYDLDYTITEHHGKATIQFFVYDAAQTASVDGVTESIYGSRLATEKVVFDILEGVPTILPNSFDEEGDVSTILNRILWNLASTKSAYNNVKEDVGILTEEMVTIKTDVSEISHTTIPNLSAQFSVYIETFADEARSNYATDVSAEMDDKDYRLHISLKNSKGETIGEGVTIDLPLEQLVVSGAYDANTSSIVLTLKNGQTISFRVDEIVRGFVPSASVGQPFGVAKLGEDGKVLSYQLPDDIGSGGGVSEDALKDYVDNNFVAKPTSTTYGSYLIPYVVTTAGQQGVIGELVKIEYGTGANTVPRRGANGVLEVGTPTTALHATNKEYADNKFLPKPAASGIVRFNSADGTTSIYGAYQSVPGAQQIPLAKNGGRITTNTPEDDLDCTNKKYVDDNFVAKYNRTEAENGLWFVYTQNQNGVNNVLELANTAKTGKSTIPFRDSRGCLPGIGTPQNNDDAANREYVDKAVANAGGGGGTKLYKHTINTTIPDTYYTIKIVIVSATATAYTSRADIANDIKNANVFTVGQNYLSGAMSVLSNTLELYAFSNGSYTKIMSMPNEFTDNVT